MEPVKNCRSAPFFTFPKLRDIMEATRELWDFGEYEASKVIFGRGEILEQLQSDMNGAFLSRLILC